MPAEDPQALIQEFERLADELTHLIQRINKTNNLHIYPVELEMQNHELHRSQVQLEAMSARYFDLYNLAPVGYCTLSPEGRILEANLTAAGMFGGKTDEYSWKTIAPFYHQGRPGCFLLIP
jgi:PAS domain-containing protein